ncbi:MAG: PLP-dependent aminotransferase family protein [Tissierellia bacterium]|nr:PLP-dependent aminotransferase family protein [Tissierellia bacterium]
MIVDNNLEYPLYLQLYEYYKKRIVEGELKSGEKLPSKRYLSNSLGLSVNTVTRAYYLLEEEGFIIAIERRGYFVEQLSNINVGKSNQELTPFKKDKTEEILYDFSSSAISKGEFPFYTFSKLYKKVIEKYRENILMNSDPNGKLEFKIAISKYLRESRGLITNPKNIVISSGMEYLFQILFYIFPQENIFGIENPGYDVLPSMIKSRGFGVVPIEIGPEGIDLDALEKSDVSILTITPSHQFPTGTIMPISRRLQVLHWANMSSKNYVIEDDYDSEFRYVGKPIDPLKSLDTEDKVIYLGSFSKSVAPSLRISYMVLPESLMESLSEDAPFFICSVPVIEQMVMAEFLINGHFERHLNRMRRIYKKNREVAIKLLENEPKVLNISGADAGIHIVVEFDTKKSDSELKKEFLEAGISISPLSEYYSGGEPSHSKFILGFGGLTREALTEGIGKMLQIL